MALSKSCFACSEKSDLFSVHEALSLDDSLRLQNNAAELSDYCFNIEMKEVGAPYLMCSSCLDVLIKAASFKRKILFNIKLLKDNLKIEDTNMDDFQLQSPKVENVDSDSEEYMYPEICHSDNSTDEDQNSNYSSHESDTNLKIHKLLLAKKERLINEINLMSDHKIKLKTSESNMKNQPIRTSKRKRNSTIETAVLTETCKKPKRSSKKKSKKLNGLLKNEFKSLRENCKDFGLFSWYQSKYKCAVCNEIFSHKNSFKIHAKKHKKKDFEKVYPKGNFYNAPILKVDISSMKCRHCGECVTQVDAFRRHLSQTHNIRADELLERLLPFNLADDEFKCGVCSQAFVNIGGLNIHMNEHSSNFVCVHCGKRFISARRLATHTRNIHITGTFKCSQCDETFDSRSKRGYHVATVHRGIQHLCQHCPETFKTFLHKLKHLAKEHNEELRKYKCETCPSKFLTCADLSMHTRRIHLQERNYKCVICEFSAFKPEQLEDHMISHTGERSFKCQICGKALGRHKSLVQHMKIHNNDKRHVCQHCERAFVQKCSLNAHLKTHENDSN